MQTLTASVLMVLAVLPVLKANDPADAASPLYYDYHSLRIGGLVAAGILCAMGIIILLSGKCRCKFNKNQPRRSEAQQGQQLITPGSASNC
ncbi:FXYD domain-containing ion transport regulator 3-like [Ambystoma mexicanum]|uniref:FXYD domain-containing ion transport regulator 3-like n=1 Tax=Ambystoma mexicanum TaxID=8296 RepID=UPI0037E7B3B7